MSCFLSFSLRESSKSNSPMIRKQTAILKVSDLTYIRKVAGAENLTFRLADRKCMLEALATCDSQGRFLVEEHLEETEGKRAAVYEGRITEVRFQGKRKLTRAELNELPFEPDNQYTEESATYSFRQWRKEGKPLRVKLHRREEYGKSFY